MKKLVMAAAALAVSTGTATAQDAAYDWSGAYIGAQVGYIWGDSLTRNFVGGTFDLFATPEADGTLGGIYNSRTMLSSAWTLMSLGLGRTATSTVPVILLDCPGEISMQWTSIIQQHCALASATPSTDSCRI